MENRVILEPGNEHTFNSLPSSEFNFNLDHDASSCGELLEEMESYWDDLNSRLTISRMVSDSVIKGIVNAIELEAAKRVSSKEAEILILNKRLQFYDTSIPKDNQLDKNMKNLETPMRVVESQNAKLGFNKHSLVERVELHQNQCLTELKLVAKNQLKGLKEEINCIRDDYILCGLKVGPAEKDFSSILIQKLNVMYGYADELETVLTSMHQQIDDTCLLDNLVSEHQWEHKFQQEITAFVVQNLIREQQDDFEAKISKEKNLLDIFNNNWQKTIEHLSTMRLDLDGISSSLVSLEPSDNLVLLKTNELAVSHHCPSDVEKKEVTDSPQLKNITKGDQIVYLKKEIARMKRQHELELQEKTEELFSLKREYLNQKGSIALHLRGDKDNEFLRKKITGFVSILDNILVDHEKLLIVQNHKNLFHSLSHRIDMLLYENQQLWNLLVDKGNLIICNTSQSPDILSKSAKCSQIGEDFPAHRGPFKLEMEDNESETIVRDKIQSIVLKCLVAELKVDMECLDLECKIAQDIYFIFFRGYITDVISRINSFIEKLYKDYFAAVVVEKEAALYLKMEENKGLKHEIHMLHSSVTEKEKLLFDTEIKLTQQQEHINKMSHEIYMLRCQLSNQSLYIAESRKETDSMMADMLQQVQEYEAELRKINQKYKVASDTQKELEKQNNMLLDLVEEKQMKLASAFAKEKEHARFLSTITSFITALSESILQHECQLENKLADYESRLEFLSDQCSVLLQQTNFLNEKVCLYKQRFERKCSDLQKAETEVDLLGDEVDVLLHLLERIYTGLEHYSPILQHYPGASFKRRIFNCLSYFLFSKPITNMDAPAFQQVVEVLRLIRREIESNST